MNRTLALLICAAAGIAGWVAYSHTAMQPAGVLAPLTPKVSGSKVYFVPVGDFSSDLLNPLVRYYRQKYGLEISVLQSIPVNPTTRDASRGQLMAENLAAYVRSGIPEYANDPKAILIGFTSEDMYPVSKGWQFAFGWRMSNAGTAVVSTARLNLPYTGSASDSDFPTTRMRKIVTKDIGILYYGLSQSPNQKSVLYNQIMGIEVLDAVGDNF